MSTKNISLCMIVKNEERCIQRCLDSVKDVVQEIIIVDTGCTDNTIQLVESYGAKIFKFEWINDFAAARNFAIAQATGDYILHLDADEYLDEGTHFKELTKDYYMLNIRNDLGSGFAEVHMFVRLFRNIPELAYKNALHEQLMIHENPHLTGELMNITIHHDGYLQEVVKNKNKTARNMEILKKEVERNPDSFTYFNLGNQYKYENKYNEAIEAYKKSYALDKSSAIVTVLLVYLTQCLCEAKRYEEALNVSQMSLELYPDYVNLIYMQGIAYEKIGYVKDAEICYLKCLELGEAAGKYATHQEGIGSYLAHAHLCEMYANLGQKDKALNQLQLALTTSKHFIPLLKILSELFPVLDSQDLFEFLQKSWRISEAKHVSSLILAFYKLRHPVVLVFMDRYKLTYPIELQAMKLLHEKDYRGALKIWEDCEEIEEQNNRDLFLLSVLTQTSEVLERNKHLFNLNKEEWNILKSIVTRRNLIHKHAYSQELVTIIENLLQDTLSVQEYELLDYFAQNITDSSLRYNIALKLKNYGYTDAALEMITDANHGEDKANIYELVGDLLKDKGMLGDSYFYYKESLKYKKEFRVMYKIYLLSVEIADNGVKEEIIKMMQTVNPVSPWVQGLI